MSAIIPAAMVPPEMKPCVHDLPPGQCAFCTPRPIPGFAQPSGLGPWIDAGYGSGCHGCGEPIEPGDRIRSDGNAGWLCSECGEEDGERR